MKEYVDYTIFENGEVQWSGNTLDVFEKFSPDFMKTWCEEIQETLDAVHNRYRITAFTLGSGNVAPSLAEAFINIYEGMEFDVDVLDETVQPGDRFTARFIRDDNGIAAPQISLQVVQIRSTKRRVFELALFCVSDDGLITQWTENPILYNNTARLRDLLSRTTIDYIKTGNVIIERANNP